ncbi:MAG: sulfite exporter TauE/SafE family protein [Spongiibacteraceae bacterium]|jgi:uncharacterized membrane protein YfcA|nr:sulfite exporter TauE/SafE family protein [Spongiibacteraceae bacterium]
MFADFELIYVFAGLAVGFIVGMTGVGGGSLMTPILLHFGIPPTSAVGTDLLYAAITKGGGVYVHQKKRNIDWRITGWLAAGSVPASFLTLGAMHAIGFDSEGVNKLIKTSLGFALLFTALAIAFKGHLKRFSGSESWLSRMRNGQQIAATIIVGLVLGVVVTITSIGAGAIGTVALFMLYPLMPTVRLIGTEIAHAVPLTLVAGLGHAGFGNVDWQLLVTLLLGSLPGIYFGSHMAHRVGDRWLRPVLATMLAVVGTRLVF